MGKYELGSLSVSEQKLLAFMYGKETVIRSEIAEGLGTGTNTLSSNLKDLERKGYIYYERGKTGHEIKQYTLTDFGKSVALLLKTVENLSEGRPIDKELLAIEKRFFRE